MAKEAAVLKAPGKRVTGQRMLLLELIRQAGGHVDADELHRRARESYPRLSLSTVYRNLQLFKEMGLVDAHDFSEPHCHYEVKPRSEHQHMLCSSCGQIVEFSSPLVEAMKRQVEKEHGFAVTRVDVYLEGVCASCADQKGV